MIDAPSSGAPSTGRSPEELGRYLEARRTAIVDTAMACLGRAHLHNYTAEGVEKARQRIEALFEVTLECVRIGGIVPMLTHADRVARERFWSGYGLSEVQTAFNVLEEAIWSRMLHELDAADFARGLGMVSTVLGMGKDALARTWVGLATRSHAPSLNWRALFGGTD